MSGEQVDWREVADRLAATLRKHIRHYECIDCYYSCPKAESYCNDNVPAGSLCDCGADEALSVIVYYDAAQSGGYTDALTQAVEEALDVRITRDADGNVTDVRPDPGRVSMRREEFLCPLCRQAIELTISYEPKLVHGANGRKGFFYVDCNSSGIEHTCDTTPHPDTPDV